VSNIVTTGFDDDEDLDGMDPERLIEAIIGGITMSVRGLVRAARAWAKASALGVDLSRFRGGTFHFLPLIAAGVVAAEAVLAFSGLKNKLRAVTALPPADQKRLAAGAPVKLVVRHGDEFTKRQLPVSALTDTQVKQVFGDRCIRTEQEQIALLESVPIVTLPPKAVTTGRVTVDRSQAVVRIGTNSAPITDVIEALRKGGVLPT
jgi:hypothetical protein